MTFKDRVVEPARKNMVKKNFDGKIEYQYYGVWLEIWKLLWKGSVLLVVSVASMLQKDDGFTAMSDNDVTSNAVSWFKIRKGDRCTPYMYWMYCVRLHLLLVPYYDWLSKHLQHQMFHLPLKHAPRRLWQITEVPKLKNLTNHLAWKKVWSVAHT